MNQCAVDDTRPVDASQIRVSVSVMAHPVREESAHRVVRGIGGLPARVVLDPEPAGNPSALRTALRAWEPWDLNVTHHLVLQDDVEPCRDFHKELLSAVAAQPQAVLSFFAEWGSRTSHAIRIAALADCAWVQPLDRYVPTQALLMPRKWAQQFAESMRTEPLDQPDDEVMLRYVVANQLPCFVAIPNLVEHLDLASLCQNDWRGSRRSSCLMTEATVPGWWRREPLRSLKTVPYFPWRDALPLALTRDGEGIEDWKRRELSEIIDAGTAEILREIVAQRLARSLESERLRTRALQAVVDLGMVVLAQVLCALSISGGAASLGEVAPLGLSACSTAAPGVLRGILTVDEHRWMAPKLAASIPLAVQDVLRLFKGGRLRAVCARATS